MKSSSWLLVVGSWLREKSASASWSSRAVVAVLWIVAAAAVVGVYRLGYLHGEIAAMEVAR